MKNTPKGILIVSIILFIAAVMALVVATSTLIPGTPLDILWTLNNSFPPGFKFTTLGIVFGVFILFLGLILLFAVWGLPKGRKWAWWITVIIFAANGIGNLAKIAMDGIEGIMGMLIAAVFLFYLTQPGIRAFFKFS